MTDSALLTTEDGVRQVQEALAEQGLDGWLLVEFRGQNWISAELLGAGWTTRRTFALVPREGRPTALIHAIEGSAWRHWPWDVERYAGWREMESKLATLVDDHHRLAVEFSPGAAVPTVDLVPAGTIELLRGAGVEPVSSGDLVSRFFSAWSAEQLADHRRTAEVVAEVGKGAFGEAARALRAGEGPTEGSITRWILERLERGGVTVDVDTHVAVGARAADPHYAPEGDGERIEAGEVLLVDLWGRSSTEAVSADQTWMGFMGATAPERIQRLWTIVRDSRDAGVALLRERAAAGTPVMGYEVDDVCRRVIADAGYGEYFIHRTGHSIDRKLHGSGPNLDNLETRDVRRIIPGVGFSIEPGIYLPDDVGLRSEINAHFGEDGPEVTPVEPQTDLILLDV
ncbi:M24 family metallopeptidase [Gaopeijia maritima]|uniref:M24 family metallopeptidase n=1 Tax=Gaopeijia maritima TaxID=3119007 RepID=UPI0032461992